MLQTLVAWLIWAIEENWPLILFVVALILLSVGIAYLLGISYRSKSLMVIVCALMICIPFLESSSLFSGPNVSASLIYQFGLTGQAVVIAKEATGNIYNNRPVARYTVKLQQADGQKVETHFDSSDFNIYPSRNSVRYPSVGQSFDVRYLEKRPQSFVILLEGDSPYAQSLRR